MAATLDTGQATKDLWSRLNELVGGVLDTAYDFDQGKFVQQPDRWTGSGKSWMEAIAGKTPEEGATQGAMALGPVAMTAGDFARRVKSIMNNPGVRKGSEIADWMLTSAEPLNLEKILKDLPDVISKDLRGPGGAINFRHVPGGLVTPRNMELWPGSIADAYHAGPAGVEWVSRILPHEISHIRSNRLFGDNPALRERLTKPLVDKFGDPRPRGLHSDKVEALRNWMYDQKGYGLERRHPLKEAENALYMQKQYGLPIAEPYEEFLADIVGVESARRARTLLPEGFYNPELPKVLDQNLLHDLFFRK